MRIIYKRLSSAHSFEEVKGEFEMLEGLATNPNSPCPLKTMWGLAYLMEDKEWYDLKKGLDIIKTAAENADEREPFCWYVLGSLYLNGKEGLEKDPVSAKYWLEKSAKVGYRNAENLMELQWGDNPDGFLDWFEGRMERRRPNWIVWGLIGVVVVILVILLFKLWYFKEK
ncbi:MAG: sel1 repeat family protein [Bacteroidaceae bacterium]|nr:sel1 repeat family protein [Bacteroidaceae bacterium]